jgi:hypothetical protein
MRNAAQQFTLQFFCCILPLLIHIKFTDRDFGCWSFFLICCAILATCAASTHTYTRARTHTHTHTHTHKQLTNRVFQCWSFFFIWLRCTYTHIYTRAYTYTYTHKQLTNRVFRCWSFFFIWLRCANVTLSRSRIFRFPHTGRACQCMCESVRMYI